MLSPSSLQIQKNLSMGNHETHIKQHRKFNEMGKFLEREENSSISEKNSLVTWIVLKIWRIVFIEIFLLKCKKTKRKYLFRWFHWWIWINQHKLHPYFFYVLEEKHQYYWLYKTCITQIQMTYRYLLRREKQKQIFLMKRKAKISKKKV